MYTCTMIICTILQYITKRCTTLTENLKLNVNSPIYSLDQFYMKFIHLYAA